MREYKDNSRHGYDGTMAKCAAVTPNRLTIWLISSPTCAELSGADAAVS